MREYTKNPPHEIDDDLDISIEIHSPSKGEPGYKKPAKTEDDEDKVWLYVDERIPW